MYTGRHRKSCTALVAALYFRKTTYRTGPHCSFLEERGHRTQGNLSEVWGSSTAQQPYAVLGSSEWLECKTAMAPPGPQQLSALVHSPMNIVKVVIHRSLG